MQYASTKALHYIIVGFPMSRNGLLLDFRVQIDFIVDSGPFWCTFSKKNGGQIFRALKPPFFGGAIFRVKTRTSHVLCGITDSFHQNVGTKLGFMLENVAYMGFLGMLISFLKGNMAGTFEIMA